MKMQEMNQSDAAGWIAAAMPTISKLFPAGLGALIMVAIDPPESRRELFWRLVAAGACSIFMGDTAMDILHSWWSVIDPAKHTHQAAVSFIVGACGWFVLGALGVLLKKLKADPVGTVVEVKKDLTP